MNTNGCATIADNVTHYLRGNIHVSPFGNGCLVVTPYLNADHASIEIVVQPAGTGYRLSDAGETLNQLFVSGLVVEENEDLMQQAYLIADLNDVVFRDSELFAQVKADDLGEAIHRLAGAIQAVSYFVFKKTHRTRPRFEEEVEKFLISHRVRYEPRFRIHGYASNHTVPFFIGLPRNVMLETLSAGTIGSARGKAKQIAYKWSDLQRQFADMYQYMVVIDDKNVKNQELWQDTEVANPLRIYSNTVLHWSIDQVRLLHLVTGNGSLL